MSRLHGVFYGLWFFGKKFMVYGFLGKKLMVYGFPDPPKPPSYSHSNCENPLTNKDFTSIFVAENR